jgi:hypothetical protein
MGIKSGVIIMDNGDKKSDEQVLEFVCDVIVDDTDTDSLIDEYGSFDGLSDNEIAELIIQNGEYYKHIYVVYFEVKHNEGSAQDDE